MRTFDGGAEASVVERAIGHAADVLLLPGSVAWTPWASKNLPNAVEWVLFMGNSLLWGFLVALLLRRLKRPAAAA
jgi:hypothetical protein